MKILSQTDKRLQRKTRKFCADKQTDRQTNKQTDPNLIPSPSARVTIIYNEVKMNRKKLRRLTPDSVAGRGKGTKTGRLSFGDSGDEQAMRRNEEDDDEASR